MKPYSREWYARILIALSLLLQSVSYVFAQHPGSLPLADEADRAVEVFQDDGSESGLELEGEPPRLKSQLNLPERADAVAELIPAYLPTLPAERNEENGVETATVPRGGAAISFLGGQVTVIADSETFEEEVTLLLRPIFALDPEVGRGELAEHHNEPLAGSLTEPDAEADNGQSGATGQAEEPTSEASPNETTSDERPENSELPAAEAEEAVAPAEDDAAILGEDQAAFLDIAEGQDVGGNTAAQAEENAALLDSDLEGGEVVWQELLPVYAGLNGEALRFELAVQRRQDGQPLAAFDHYLHIVIDLRHYEQESSGAGWFVSVRDDADPLLWHQSQLAVHDPAGLFSAAIDAPGILSTGYIPSPWRYQWNAPAPSSFSGAATYSYPIELPPGRAGLAPNIDISYSSRSVDSLIFTDSMNQGSLGMGWSFNHIEIVRDSIHTLDQYGHVRLQHPNHFSLILDGAGHELRLVNMSGNVATYYAVNAPSLRVQQFYDLAAGSPDRLYWRVAAPNGAVYRLGYMADAVSGQQHVQCCLDTWSGQQAGLLNNYGDTRWQVDMVTDVYGNQIQYSYITWNHVEWYQSTSGTWTAFENSYQRLREIRYNYVDRAANANHRLTGAHGSRIVFEPANGSRINQIKLYHLDSSAPYRIINIGLGAFTSENHYCGQGGRQSNTEVVTWIRQHNRDGTIFLPATTFSYIRETHLSDGNYNSDTQWCYRFARLQEVNNGYGGSVRFNYITDNRIEEWWWWGLGRPPQFGRSFFVNSTQTWDGVHTAPALTTYQFQTPCYDQFTGGSSLGTLPGAFNCPLRDWYHGYSPGKLVGFAQVDITHRNYGGQQILKQTVSRFWQTRERMGRLSWEQLKTGDGFLLQQKNIDYSRDTGASWDFTFANQECTTSYVRGGQSSQHCVNYEYARQNNVQYGNLTALHESGYIGGVTTERRVLRDYYPNTTTWVVGAVARERVLGPSNSLRSETRNFYDGSTSWNVQPGMGRLTRVDRMKEVEAPPIAPTPTPSPTPTNTPLPTATNTPIPTATNTPVPTATNTPIPTATNTPLPTATHTPIPTATNTPVPTATNTPIPTATNTPVPTATNTPIPTATNTPVPTATHTPMPTATSTPSAPPVIAAFTGNGQIELNLVPGDWLRLEWVSIDAMSCLASGGWTGRKATSGSEAFVFDPGLEPRIDYELSCSNSVGTSPMHRVIVHTASGIVPPPPPPDSIHAGEGATSESDGSGAAGDGGVPSSGYPTYITVQRMQYDAYGNVTHVWDGRNNRTLTAYDGTYNLYPVAITNPLDHVETLRYYYLNATYNDGPPGLLREHLDANGFWTYYFYDAFGRLHKVFRGWAEQGGDFSKPSEIYFYYDLSSHLLTDGRFMIGSWKKTQDNATQWSAGGVWERELFDGFGNLIQSQRPHTNWQGSGQGQEIITDIRYNAAGQAVWQSVPYLRPAYEYGTENGRIISPYHNPDLTQPRVHSQYDAAGREVRRVGLDNDVTSTVYGLRSVYTQNANNNLHAAFFDQVGQLVAVDEKVNGFSDAFDNPALPGWSKNGNVSVTGGIVRLIGNDTWGTTLARSLATTAADGIGVAFRTNNAGARANIFLSYGGWNTSAYRRWSLNLEGGQLVHEEWTGSSITARRTLMPLKANTWYRVMLRTSRSNVNHSLVVWEEGNPDVFAEIRLPKDNSWKLQGWLFTAQVYTNNVALDLDNYAEFDFYRTHYNYDLLGNLTTVTNATGHQSQMTYDALGLKRRMIDPDMGAWYYTYDNAGNLIQQTDARLQTIAFTYDALNRLTHKRQGVNGPLLAQYGYDSTANNNRGRGRRTSMTAYDPPGTGSNSASWHYDIMGRVTQETRSVAGNSYVFQFGYTQGDVPVTVRYPGGPAGQLGETVTTNYYWQTGQPRTLAGSSNYVTNTTYREFGAPLQMNLGTNIVTTYGYDVALRLNGLQTQASGTDRLHLSLAYDKVSNVTRIGDYTPPNGGSTQWQFFTYDSLNRLTSAYTSGGNAGGYNHTGNNNYVYNATGNLTRKAGVNMAYNGGKPHAVTHLNGSQRFWYDANGNMTRRIDENNRDWTQTWTIENQLKQATAGSDTVTFTYDADGMMVRRNDNGQQTVYLGKLYQHNLNTGIATRHYTFGGKLVALREGNNNVNFLLTDHLGSVTTTLWADGTVRANLRYDPWGKQRWASQTTPTRYRFTAQRFDDKLGLYDYNARYYDASIGRFISADVIVPDPTTPQQFNRYAYALNNPLVYVDPDGHRPQSVTFRFLSGAEMSRAFDALIVAEKNRNSFVENRTWAAAGIGASIGIGIGATVMGLTGTATIPGAGTAAGVVAGGLIGGAVGYLAGNGVGKYMAANDPILNDLGKIGDFLSRNVVLHEDNRLEVRLNSNESFFADSWQVTLDVQSSWTGNKYLAKFVFSMTAEDGTLYSVLYEIEIGSATYWLLKALFEKAQAEPLHLELHTVPRPPTPPITPIP
jgi:RHS repeat-associated protein